MLIDACDVDEADVDDVFGSSSLEKNRSQEFSGKTRSSILQFPFSCCLFR